MCVCVCVCVCSLVVCDTAHKRQRKNWEDDDYYDSDDDTFLDRTGAGVYVHYVPKVHGIVS